MYPGAWRRRYGEEFSALLELMPVTPAVVLDVAVAAARDRFVSMLRSLGLRSDRGPLGPDPMGSLRLAAAALLLIPSIVTLGAFALKFKAGVDAPLETFWFQGPRLLRNAVIFLPYLSLAIAAVPMMSVRVFSVDGRLSATVGIRLRRVNVVIAVFSSCVIYLLWRYFIAQHLFRV